MIPALETPRSQGDDTGRSIARTTDRWEYLMINKEPCPVELLTNRTTTDLASSFSGDQEDAVVNTVDIILEDEDQYMQVVSEHSHSTAARVPIIYEARGVATDDDEDHDDEDLDEAGVAYAYPVEQTSEETPKSSDDEYIAQYDDVGEEDSLESAPRARVFSVSYIIRQNDASTIRQAIANTPIIPGADEPLVPYSSTQDDFKIGSVVFPLRRVSSARPSQPDVDGAPAVVLDGLTAPDPDVDEKTVVIQPAPVGIVAPTYVRLPPKKSPIRRRTIEGLRAAQQPLPSLLLRQTSSDEEEIAVTMIALPEDAISPRRGSSMRSYGRRGILEGLIASPLAALARSQRHRHSLGTIGAVTRPSAENNPMNNEPKVGARIESNFDPWSPRSAASLQSAIGSGLASARNLHDRVTCISGRTLPSATLKQPWRRAGHSIKVKPFKASVEVLNVLSSPRWANGDRVATEDLSPAARSVREGFKRKMSERLNAYLAPWSSRLIINSVDHNASVLMTAR